jgi:hypothetical protein
VFNTERGERVFSRGGRKCNIDKKLVLTFPINTPMLGKVNKADYLTLGDFSCELRQTQTGTTSEA